LFGCALYQPSLFPPFFFKIGNYVSTAPVGWPSICNFAELAEQFSIFFVLRPGFLNHKPRLFESCNKRGGGLDQRTNQHLGRVIQRLIPESTVARRYFIYVGRSLYQVRPFAVRGLARDGIQSVFLLHPQFSDECE